MLNIKLLLTILTSLFIVSCGDDGDFMNQNKIQKDIHPNLVRYIEAFEDEAAARGKYIDLERLRIAKIDYSAQNTELGSYKVVKKEKLFPELGLVHDQYLVISIPGADLNLDGYNRDFHYKYFVFLALGYQYFNWSSEQLNEISQEVNDYNDLSIIFENM